MTTPALDIPLGPLGQAFLGGSAARRSTRRTWNPQAAFVAAACPHDNQQDASSTSAPRPRCIVGEQNVRSKPADVSSTLETDRFLAKLDLLLGIEHRSGGQNQVSTPLDFNAIYDDLREVVLDIDVRKRIVGFEPLIASIQERIVDWMDRRVELHLGVFKQLVQVPHSNRGQAQWSIQLLQGVEEYLDYQATQAEQEIQLANLLQQFFNPLTYSPHFVGLAEWAYKHVVYTYTERRGSKFRHILAKSFKILLDGALRLPVVEAPLMLYNFPGVLQLRWAKARLPGFIRSYLRLRALFGHSNKWFGMESIVEHYEDHTDTYLEKLAPRILQRCKLETSSLIRPATQPQPQPKASRLVPDDEQVDADPMELDSTAVQPLDEPEQQEPTGSIHPEVNRSNVAALYANWAWGVIEFELNLALIMFGDNQTKVRRLMRSVIDRVVDEQWDEFSPAFGTLLDAASWHDLGVLYRLASTRLQIAVHLNPEDNIVNIPSDGLFGLVSPIRSSRQLQPQESFLKTFRAFAQSKTTSIVQTEDKDEDMIPDLLRLWHELSSASRQTFQGQADSFLAALRDGFATGIAKRSNKPAEMLAKHLDATLRSGHRRMDEAQLESALDNALILFRFIKDKDMFEEFYTRHFAKRLLHNKSASSDAEASMLLKLKMTTGAEFTERLETMLKDITVSEDMVSAWEVYVRKATQAHPNEDKRLEYEMSVNVLTMGHWPSYPDHGEVRLPPELARGTKLFESFYASRNQGRQLRWQHNLGSHVVLAHLPNKKEPRELVVSTYQALVLLLFNPICPLDDALRTSTSAIPHATTTTTTTTTNSIPHSLSYDQIAQATNLPEGELKRVLQSLACGPIPNRVLRKHPQGKDVDSTDRFTINERLKNERLRFRINQIQMKETTEERQTTESHVFLERELVLQAATVRILKAKRTIGHNDLLQQVIRAISSRFTVEVAEIKRAFEVLIEKDYMERASGQRNVYVYVA